MDNLNELHLGEVELEIIKEFVNLLIDTASNSFEHITNKKVDIEVANINSVIAKELKLAQDKDLVYIEMEFDGDLNGVGVFCVKREVCEKFVKIINGEEFDKTADNADEIAQFILNSIEVWVNEYYTHILEAFKEVLNNNTTIKSVKVYSVEYFDAFIAENFDEDEDLIIENVSVKLEEDGEKFNFERIYNLQFSRSIVDLLYTIDHKSINNIEEIGQQMKEEDFNISGEDVYNSQQAAFINEELNKYSLDGRRSRNVMSTENAKRAQAMVPEMFDGQQTQLSSRQSSNLDLVMTVPVDVSVEIGRTKRKIKEILEFSKGTLIELDRLAGEHMDIFVNGKCIAKGDIVVIDDKFGVRITEIIRTDNMFE